MGELQRVKVLSVRQPWATAIVMGWKDIENRSWSTNYRGRLYIHASATRSSRDEFEGDEEFIVDCSEHRLFSPLSIPPHDYGAIVGHVEVVGVLTRSDSPWFFGPFGWLLRNPETIQPIPMKGRLGIFAATIEV